MRKIKAGFFLIALLFIFNAVSGQEISGLWGIIKVQAGNNEMTPGAKWTMINEDGTFRSGNGWIQNSVGTWKWDRHNNKFEAHNTYGIHDEFGAFDMRVN